MLRETKNMLENLPLDITCSSKLYSSLLETEVRRTTAIVYKCNTLDLCHIK